MRRQNNPTTHNAYSAMRDGAPIFGIESDTRSASAKGSAKLLAAILLYYERHHSKPLVKPTVGRY